MKKTTLGLALLLCLALPLQSAWGFVPDRRRLYEERDPNTYMLLPMIASLPGVGVFGGILGSFSNILDSGIDAAITEASTISGDSDIHVRAYALREIPLLIPGLQLEYWFGDIKFDDYHAYLPGKDSPDFTIPYTGEFDYYFLQPSLKLWERRLNLYYGLVFFKGYAINEDGEEELQANHYANGSLLLDFTDDVVDPRKGLRLGHSRSLKAPKKSVLGKSNENENAQLDSQVTTYQNEITAYVPFGEQFTLVLFRQNFWAVGKEDSGEVITGGSLPLRGYPGGRWSDRYGETSALEGRYTIPTNFAFDNLLIQGKLDGLQLAGFYEQGAVSPEEGALLQTEIKHSYGGGVRALIDAIVLRFDLAFSEAGSETHLTIDQPF